MEGGAAICVLIFTYFMNKLSGSEELFKVANRVSVVSALRPLDVQLAL